MNLQHAILNEHSKASVDRIVRWVGHDQQRFDELFKLFTGKDPLIAQRAGWSMSYAVSAHPVLINKHMKALLKNLQKPTLHNAIIRNSVRLLQDISIPEAFQGDVMNLCFDYVTDPKQLPAIKAFSLTVLDNLAKDHPDIINELRTIIESQWENEGPAFRSRARRILNKINRKSY